MHKFFAEWYRIARIEPKSDDLPKRWAGIEAAIESLTTADGIEIVKIFLGVPSARIEFREKLQSTFQKADPAFPMRDNETELRVLAGAIIVQYVETKRTTSGDALALALVSGACPFAQRSVLLPEIVTAAENYLFKEGITMRSNEPHSEVKSLLPKADQLLPKVKKTAEQGAVPATLEALESPFQKLHGGIEATAKAADTAASHLSSLISGLREQTDILWWIFSGTSRDLKQPFANLPLSSVGFIAGKELADLIQLLPGPIAAPAVLEKVLCGHRAGSENTSFEAAVDGLDNQWRQACLEGTDAHLDGLAPIHFAFRKSVEAASWIKSFETASGIKLRKISFTPWEIACQMYNERLLRDASRK